MLHTLSNIRHLGQLWRGRGAGSGTPGHFGFVFLSRSRAARRDKTWVYARTPGSAPDKARVRIPGK
jgi:hypothetical protein